MIKKISVSTILFLIVTSFLFSQEKVYVDVNMNYINKKEYKKKCKANIFVCKKDKIGSKQINRIYYKYEFGRISSTEVNKLRELLVTQTGIEINKNSNIIIKYSDTLFDYKAIEKRREQHYNKHNKTILFNTSNISKKREKKISERYEYKPLTLKTYIKNHIEFINNQKKCIKKAKLIYNTEAFYMYDIDLGHNVMWPDLNWIQDSTNVFKNKFFKIPNYNAKLIIKPNGEFFVSNANLDEKMQIILLKNNWQTIINDWRLSVEQLKKNGFGFFNIDESFKRAVCF